MKTKSKTFLTTILIASVPLGLLWKENASLRAQTAAQSLTLENTFRPAQFLGSFIGAAIGFFCWPPCQHHFVIFVQS